MDGCDGVRNVTLGPAYTLVGTDYDHATGQAHAVLSNDHGRNWRIVASAKGRPGDAAYDPQNRVAFLTAGGNLFRKSLDDDAPAKVLDLPRDQFGALRVRSVAIDPHSPQVVYATQNKDIYASNASAMRSLDGGDTWEVLTRQEPLTESAGLDGGREAIIVRVHPGTRDAWFGTGCYGTWRYPAPPLSQP